MKKKILSITLALCFVFGTASALPQSPFTSGTEITAAAVGEYFEVDDIKYFTSDSKTAQVYKYTGNGGNVTIPKTANGMTVTTICEDAFYSTAHSKDIKEVTLPNTITEIGTNAFGSTGLTKINLPNSLTTLGTNTFRETHLKTVTLPKKLTGIPSSTFYGIKELEQITIPANIKTIGSYAFESCNVLKKVQFSEGLMRIQSNAFDSCVNLTQISLPSTLAVIGNEAFARTPIQSITIPKNVVQIGDGAFRSCEKLKSATLNSGLQSLGKSTFSYCKALQSISLPDSLTAIEDYTFNHCYSLKSIKLPKKLKSIGAEVFSECDNLEAISLPNTLTTLGKYTFFSCDKLTSVIIPSSVTELPESLFNCCHSLESVSIPTSVKKLGISTFTFCEKLKRVTLPDGITEIPERAFYACGVEKVVLPSGLKTIGEDAFSFCGGLSDIIIPSTVTSIGKKAFFQSSNINSIIIPDSVTAIGEKAMGVYDIYNNVGETIATKPIKGFKLIFANNMSARNYADKYKIDYVQRLAGKNRYATAAFISMNSYDSANTVVIASGENYADALAGVTYAKSINAPILLTKKDALPLETLVEIKATLAKKAIILGGTEAVSDNVKTILEQNVPTVERIYGEKRYSTAVKIAEKTNSAPTDLFFVVGNNYADALSVSAVAAIKKAPIIYLTTSGELNKDTAQYLAKLKDKGCVKNAYVIGGTNAISPDMLKKASNALGVKAKRIAGSNRYQTCIAINNEFSSLFVPGNLCLATGNDFPDALAGGVFAAKKLSPLMLIGSSVSQSQAEYLKGTNPHIMYVFGGTGAVSDKTVKAAAACY